LADTLGVFVVVLAFGGIEVTVDDNVVDAVGICLSSIRFVVGRAGTLKHI
jgi:hypothetical protein